MNIFKLKKADAAVLADEDSGEEDEETKPNRTVFRPNTYGAIEGEISFCIKRTCSVVIGSTAY